MFFSSKKSILGVDIGTANIKIAQVTQEPKPILNTYGIVNTNYQLSSKNDTLAIEQTAKLLKELAQRSGVTTKKCVISFPNSSVFSSVIEMPKMKESEMATAVEFEAKKYVPLALSEVDLQWAPVDESASTLGQHKILLTALPKVVSQNYKRVFEVAGLELVAADIESLALIRSLIGTAPLGCVIIDIGARGTGINIIEKGFLRLSRNLNMGGDTITDKIAEALNVSYFRAEQFKKDFGISGTTFIPETVKPVLAIIKNEVKQLLNIYHSQNGSLEKIILVGGGANMPGIIEFFSDLNLKVELGNPLEAVGYQKNLESVLQRYQLSLPISIGLALRKD